MRTPNDILRPRVRAPVMEDAGNLFTLRSVLGGDGVISGDERRPGVGGGAGGELENMGSPSPNMLGLSRGFMGGRFFTDFF